MVFTYNAQLIPKYDDWKSETKLKFYNRRSGNLKKLDDAIDKYWKNNKTEELAKGIKIALMAWSHDRVANSAPESHQYDIYYLPASDAVKVKKPTQRKLV